MENDEPTLSVKQLIERLKALPPDMPVVIHDADTDWHLPIEWTKVIDYDGTRTVELGGTYHGTGRPWLFECEEAVLA